MTEMYFSIEDKPKKEILEYHEGQDYVHNNLEENQDVAKWLHFVVLL